MIGQYTVNRQVNAGGYGVVFSVNDLDGTEKYLKVFRRNDPEMKRLIDEEFNMARRFDHPNVMKILEKQSEVVFKNIDTQETGQCSFLEV